MEHVNEYKQPRNQCVTTISGLNQFTIHKQPITDVRWALAPKATQELTATCLRLVGFQYASLINEDSYATLLTKNSNINSSEMHIGIYSMQHLGKYACIGVFTTTSNLDLLLLIFCDKI